MWTDCFAEEKGLFSRTSATQNMKRTGRPCTLTRLKGVTENLLSAKWPAAQRPVGRTWGTLLVVSSMETLSEGPHPWARTRAFRSWPSKAVIAARAKGGWAGGAGAVAGSREPTSFTHRFKDDASGWQPILPVSSRESWAVVCKPIRWWTHSCVQQSGVVLAAGRSTWPSTPLAAHTCADNQSSSGQD